MFLRQHHANDRHGNTALWLCRIGTPSLLLRTLHPINSHSSPPLHLTQGISLTSFSHLPVQNFLLSSGTSVSPCWFSLPCPLEDSKSLSALPLRAAPSDPPLLRCSTFRGAKSYTGLIALCCSSQGWGCPILYYIPKHMTTSRAS